MRNDWRERKKKGINFRGEISQLKERKDPAKLTIADKAYTYSQ